MGIQGSGDELTQAQLDALAQREEEQEDKARRADPEFNNPYVPTELVGLMRALPAKGTPVNKVMRDQWRKVWDTALMQLYPLIGDDA